MGFVAVTLEELLEDFDLTAAKWKEFFTANPGAAEAPTDIANSGNVGGLIWHVYMASASVKHYYDYATICGNL
ncbi:MAG: hypothetical protein WA634_11560 [Silvibacterium sp.]